MLNYGHDLGRQEDYSFAFLFGHSSYYSRYGYQTNTHSDPAWATVKDEMSEAAMVCVLQEGVLDGYFAAVEKGRATGCVNWPLPFLAY